jgi:O-acetylhomoserine/O-acetylserine sulfhydrylase-like pyridoxal-dependent enzyme
MMEMAIRPETIRLSIWIGYIGDIIGDIDRALAKATAG